MNRKLLYLILLTALCVFSWQNCFLPAQSPVPVTTESRQEQKILLVPLDGRPPCRQFVIDAGHIAALDVRVPPSALQDYYSMPGDTAGMQAWVKEEASGSHALILSVDQLLYGGLLAAREREVPEERTAELIRFLRELRRNYPELPIYAFSILPRLSPQDTIDGYEERRDLMKYSRLAGKKAAGLPIDEEELQALAEKIPPESLRTYLAHFDKNEQLNRQLAGLAAEGVITRLILGQDDGEEYGIPNIEKTNLLTWLRENGIPEEKVFLTHGADEIALSLLAEIKCRDTGFRPRVRIETNDEAAADSLMPFMAVSTLSCAEEKLRMLQAVPAAEPGHADMTLFLSVNDRDADTLGSRLPSVKRLHQLIVEGHPTALVDLSRHFSPEETLLPLMLREALPLNTLLSYAGWNTASNSVGTALAQSALYLAREREIKTKGEALALCQYHLTFLHNRYLEDFFYLKDVIDKVNHSLKRAGYFNTADLDLEHNYLWADAMLQDAMMDYAGRYQKSSAVTAPFLLNTPEGPVRLRLRQLTAEISYPWPRTFEIHLRTGLTLEELP